MYMKNKIGIIEERLDRIYRRLKKCDICPRNCKVNRLKGNLGFCGGGKEVVVYTAFLHQGEEPPISEKLGSGTIFFSGCNLKCVYCQNYKFSHHLQGKVLNDQSLARIMLNLQEKGAENINLVTPTPFMPQILKSLLVAFREGLNVPIVYNTSGYEKVDVIEGLEGIVDIYLTDLKYLVPSSAQRYSQAPDYQLFVEDAIKSMYKQKQGAKWQQNRLKEAVIIRHLFLPGYTNETVEVLQWIKKNTPQALVSVMSQYQPYFKADIYPEINRKISRNEYEAVKETVEKLELEGWLQEFSPSDMLAGVNFPPTLEI